MKFKKATIDYRWSRESGYDVGRRFQMGLTYYGRRIENLWPGQRVHLHDGGPEYHFLEIDATRENEIGAGGENYGGVFDGQIFINQRMAYAFAIEGHVKDNYSVIRFYMDGFYYIFEYRFISRENS